MQPDGDLKSIAKCLIFAILCSEMHSSYVDVPSKATTYLNRFADVTNDLEASHENGKHHASVRLKGDDRQFGDGHICSGALIAQSVVLTVGQCTYDYSKNNKRHPSELSVVLGSLNRYVRNQHTLVYDVTHIYRAPKFDPHTLRNNIAILMLEKDIPTGHATVKPIPWNSDRTPGQKHQYDITSWGVTKENVPTSHLMVVNASLSTDDDCKSVYPLRTDLTCLNLLSLSHMNSRPCDVGAPVIHNYRLVGLVSHIEPGAPLVYTSLHIYTEWIREQIGDGTNRNGSFWGSLMFLILTLMSLRSTKYVKRFY